MQVAYYDDDKMLKVEVGKRHELKSRMPKEVIGMGLTQYMIYLPSLPWIKAPKIIAARCGLVARVVAS